MTQMLKTNIPDHIWYVRYPSLNIEYPAQQQVQYTNKQPKRALVKKVEISFFVLKNVLF